MGSTLCTAAAFHALITHELLLCIEIREMERNKREGESPSKEIIRGSENGRLKYSAPMCVSAAWWNISPVHAWKFEHRKSPFRQRELHMLFGTSSGESDLNHTYPHNTCGRCCRARINDYSTNVRRVAHSLTQMQILLKRKGRGRKEKCRCLDSAFARA